MQLPPVRKNVNGVDSIIVHEVVGGPYIERDSQKIVFITMVEGYFKMSKSDRLLRDTHRAEGTPDPHLDLYRAGTVWKVGPWPQYLENLADAWISDYEQEVGPAEKDPPVLSAAAIMSLCSSYKPQEGVRPRSLFSSRQGTRRPASDKGMQPHDFVCRPQALLRCTSGVQASAHRVDSLLCRRIVALRQPFGGCISNEPSLASAYGAVLQDGDAGVLVELLAPHLVIIAVVEHAEREALVSAPFVQSVRCATPLQCDVFATGMQVLIPREEILADIVTLLHWDVFPQELSYTGPRRIMNVAVPGPAQVHPAAHASGAHTLRLVGLCCAEQRHAGAPSFSYDRVVLQGGSPPRNPFSTNFSCDAVTLRFLSDSVCTLQQLLLM